LGRANPPMREWLSRGNFARPSITTVTFPHVGISRRGKLCPSSPQAAGVTGQQGAFLLQSISNFDASELPRRLKASRRPRQRCQRRLDAAAQTVYGFPAGRAHRTWVIPLGGPMRLIAIVPVAALSVGIRPIPAKIGSRANRDRSNRGYRDQGPEGDARNDRAIVGAPNPGPGKPIGPASPTRGATPGTAPTRSPPPTREELDLLNGALRGERPVEPSALTAGGTGDKQAGGQKAAHDFAFHHRESLIQYAPVDAD